MILVLKLKKPLINTKYIETYIGYYNSVEYKTTEPLLIYSFNDYISQPKIHIKLHYNLIYMKSEGDFIQLGKALI